MLRMMIPPACGPATPTRPGHDLQGLRCEWQRLARRLVEPDVELCTDTVAAVVCVYGRLKAAGGTVDPMAAALVEQLAFQLADVEAFIDG